MERGMENAASRLSAWTPAFLHSRAGVAVRQLLGRSAVPQHDCKSRVRADAFYWKRPGMPGRFAQEEGRGDADVAAPTHRSCGCVGKARRIYGRTAAIAYQKTYGETR
jgi:hypothetical protein